MSTKHFRSFPLKANFIFLSSSNKVYFLLTLNKNYTFIYLPKLMLFISLLMTKLFLENELQLKTLKQGIRYTINVEINFL